MQIAVINMFKFSRSLLTNNSKILLREYAPKAFYTSDANNPFAEKVTNWMSYNKKIYPPQDPTEERKPAFVCNQIRNVKYSPKKMWYIAVFIRGMSVDEALKQLQCLKSKGALIVTDVLKEAIDMAVNDHNVEFRTNLWVAESFCNRGLILKGLRRCARGRITKIRYRYCNYYIRLEEGQPPADYYCNKDEREVGPAMLNRWMKVIRGRKIYNSL